MKHHSYGDIVRGRVKHLFEVLLSYAYDELEGTEQLHSDLKVNWQTEKQLVVRTKLRTLEKLTEKDKIQRKLTKEEIREAINHLKNYLKILIDNRESPRGSEDWHFTLELWSKDKAENLRRFDAQWQAQLPPKSRPLSTHRESRDISISEEHGLRLPQVSVSEGAPFGERINPEASPEDLGKTLDNFLRETERMPLPLEAAGVVHQVMASSIVVSGDLEAEDMTQKASHGSSVKQEMLTDVKAQNIRLGNLSQES